MTDERITWHHGLMARWWAEFNLPEDREVEYFADAIGRFGEPALDLGCGTGRLLVPLLDRGLDVDGVDVSADMVAYAHAAAAARGHEPALTVQALHELDLPRRYRTIFVCGVLGIGGDRSRDRQALERIHDHLEPDGALVLWHEFPYAGLDERGWARWLPEGRTGVPKPWPTDGGDRRRTSDGDEIELRTRLAEHDPILSRHTYEMEARLWRDGVVVSEESYTLSENLYFAPELLLLLELAAFHDVRMEAAYEGRPATAADDTVIVVARRWAEGRVTLPAVGDTHDLPPAAPATDGSTATEALLAERSADRR
jgi:SAM-dependent methyltransferase